MSYNCKIVADSLAENGCRLTTFEVTYPLIIHAEIMTHRVFSRNVASNRAIPVKKLIASVQDNPFIPERWPANKAGMQNDTWLEGDDAIGAEAQWLYARDAAVKFAKNLGEEGYGVHKQITNRLLAPFLWTTAVITATDWNNFFGLRCHPAAQPEIQKIAYMMKEAYEQSLITNVREGEWHLPYISEETREQVIDRFATGTCTGDLDKFILPFLQQVSIGRCARVSYLNHGENNTPEKDIELCQRLIESRHMSPTEHIATPMSKYDTLYLGNFRGWLQYRKSLKGESGE
jgi:thymidylate synthase ThyX